MRTVLFVLFLLLTQGVHGQCLISVKGVPCIGNPIEFLSATPGATNHNWNFNNEGFNNTSANPKFSFSSLGSKTITYSCILPGGQACSTSVSIVIKDKPKLNIQLLSNAVQCYEGNLFCLRDSSLSGDNDKCIKTVKYLFSDGELITKYGSKNNPVALPSTICKSFIDPQGGNYTLTVEIEDCNGCIIKDTVPFIMRVELLPAIFAKADVQTGNCQGSTKVNFKNQSQIALKDVSKFVWDFGDGSKDSVNWDSVSHIYTSGGAMAAHFTPVLRIYTGNGCYREFKLNEVSVYDFNPYLIKNKDSICLGESIDYEVLPAELETQIKNDKVRWDFDPGLQYGYKVSQVYTNTIGPHLVTVTLSHPCGPYILRDTILVIGPKAIIEPDWIRSTQRFQCVARDSVMVADHSLFYHNDKDFLDDDSLSSRTPGNLKFNFYRPPGSNRNITIPPYNYSRTDENVDRLWDFDDEYCLPCTTDTKAGQNIGLNCRYSKDSAASHVYSAWDSVYAYLYARKSFLLAGYDPVFRQCGQRRVWASDSLYAVLDSVLYFGENALGLSARDSSLFAGVQRKLSIGQGLFGKAVYDAFSDLRVYIPAGSAAELDKKDGSAKLLLNGPQYYQLSAKHRLITFDTDTVYFVFGLKVLRDTLPADFIRPYHLQVRKVPLPGILAGDSIDENLHRQLFYNSVPRCFRIKLVRRDTVHPLGCISESGASVALQPPSAKKLKMDDHYCYGYNNKVLEFSLSETKPGCLASTVYFNPDYKSDPDNWQLLNNLQYGEMKRNTFLNSNVPYKGYDIEGPNNGKFFWVYNDTMLEKGRIQYINPALIIGNGVDPLTCADTVYYSRFAAFPGLDASLEFVPEGGQTDHICAGQTLYVSIPDTVLQHSEYVYRNDWFLINNESGDTLERRRELYKRAVQHPAYPGKTVNYTLLQRYKLTNGSLQKYSEDTLLTAIVHSYQAELMPGAGLNTLRQKLSDKGFDITDFHDTMLAGFIWNGKGQAGDTAFGSRGCIDTTGFGHELYFRYRIYSATPLSYKDSSLLPADSALLGGRMRKAYAFTIQRNGSYSIHRELSSLYPGYCGLESAITAAVGFRAKIEFSDTIICRGRLIEALPDFRYFNLDPKSLALLDTTKYWEKRLSEAGQNKREGFTVWDYSLEDDDSSRPATVFGSFPYARRGYGNPGILLGGEPGGLYYKTPGVYTLRVMGTDSNGCTDTIKQKLYITGPVAGFYTDIITPNCKTILEFFDTSYMDDPCAAKGLPPCDFIVKWTIDWGDGSSPLLYTKALPKQIGHDYASNGYYDITLVVESVLGCRDTLVKRIFIPGPSPVFKPESSIYICAGDSVLFRNNSVNFTASSQWLWNFGDGFYNPQTDTGIISHRYMLPGQYDVYLSQYDSIANTGKYCASVYPDAAKGQARITVTVWPYDQVEIKAFPEVVCVGDSIEISAELNSRFPYSGYFWDINQSTQRSTSLKMKFAPQQRGVYTVRWRADTTGLPAYYAYCPDFDTLQVTADSVLADFTIDESQKPIFCFDNTSKWAKAYRWGFHHDTDITLDRLEFLEDKTQDEPERRICENFSAHYGINWVCLEATNALGCKDTVCRKLFNDFEVAILPPNVFTPGGRDGFAGTDKEGLPGNNVFNIYTKNVLDYHLVVYDRWGVLVFESHDQTNDWNGRLRNSGPECPDGTYYYILNYRFLGRDKQEPVLNGVVRLIRE